MKKLLLFLVLFSIFSLPTFAQEKLRTKNYTERPDTEPVYIRTLPGSVKVKRMGGSNARTSGQVKIDSSDPGPRIPIKNKTGLAGANTRRKSPARRPGGGN